MTVQFSKAMQEMMNRGMYEAMMMGTAIVEMPSIIIPPYFDGPVFGDDYGAAVESMSGDQWTPEEIEQLKVAKAKVAKVPELPVEVYHTQPFNASAAWEAVRALSRGA